jgi:hypothetical protein
LLTPFFSQKIGTLEIIVSTLWNELTGPSSFLFSFGYSPLFSIPQSPQQQSDSKNPKEILDIID